MRNENISNQDEEYLRKEEDEFVTDLQSLLRKNESRRSEKESRRSEPLPIYYSPFER